MAKTPRLAGPSAGHDAKIAPVEVADLRLRVLALTYRKDVSPEDNIKMAQAIEVYVLGTEDKGAGDSDPL